MAAWSKSETARAQMLADAGYTYSQIAAVLERTKSSVGCRLRRLGVERMPSRPRPTSTAERDRQMIADCLAGMSHRELGEKYGLEIGSVSARLSLHGVNVPMQERIRRQRAAMQRNGSKPGRKPTWPDCPPHLRREYLALRKHYGIAAADARSQLEKMV